MKQLHPITYLLVLCLLLSSCVAQRSTNSIYEPAGPVSFTEYKNYFVKSELEPLDSQFLLAFDDYDDFSAHFELDPDKNYVPKSLSPKELKEQVAISIIDSLSNWTQDLVIQSMSFDRGALIVNYKIIEHDEIQDAATRFSSIALVNRRDIKRVIFKQDNKVTNIFLLGS